jgi:hypothetical protein
MRNTFDYTAEQDGDLYYLGENIGEVLRKGKQFARQVAMSDPTFVRTYLHTEIESQEYEAQLELASGDEQSPDLLVVISPELKEIGKHLTMIRIYQRTEAGISASSISFDKSDMDCLKAVVGFFGESIQQGCSVEDILQKRTWGHSGDVPYSDIRKYIARLHDEVLEKKYGGEWNGGRHGEYSLDAQTFIEAQEDLLADHLATLTSIQKNYHGQELAQILKAQRYNFAASLSLRLRGEPDASSQAEAGASAFSRGEAYDNSCPTGTLSAQQTLEKIGMRQEWKRGSCRVCLRETMVGGCHVCEACEDADNRGEDLATIAREAIVQRQRKHLAARAIRQEASPVVKSGSFHKPSVHHPQNKVGLVIKKRAVIGGRVSDYFDAAGTLLYSI